MNRLSEDYHTRAIAVFTVLAVMLMNPWRSPRSAMAQTLAGQAQQGRSAAIRSQEDTTFAMNPTYVASEGMPTMAITPMSGSGQPTTGPLPIPGSHHSPHGVELGESFVPWWQPHVARPMRSSSKPLTVDLEALIASALIHSAEVHVFSELPLIRDTSIIEADAAFDWNGFVETRWDDTSDPVGNLLTTGGENRFQRHVWDYEVGVRRRSFNGGQFEIGQQYGFENNNSTFFSPNNQGTSTLSLSFTQPILRGGGKIYNTSLIVLAQIDAEIARNEFSRQLQSHLLEVTRAYWSMFLERGALLQRQRLFKRGSVILEDLEHRIEIDALTNQIVRARAAVTARRADLYRSAAAVKNAEGRVRALVNDPGLGVVDEFELLPRDLPTSTEIPVDMFESLSIAVRSRPEIGAAVKQIKASAVRLNMSKNELLPILDIVLESYVAGLRGGSNVGQAWGDQFTDGAPGYAAGIQMEIPIKNRAARANFQRRQLELRQLQSQFRATIQTIQLEVEVAVREVRTSVREMHSKLRAMDAAKSEVEYITQRWRHLPGSDRSASLVLEDLLAAQERMSNEEFDYLSAQVTYNLALTNLKRALGILLQYENVLLSKQCSGCLPYLHLDKMGPPMERVGNLPAQPWAASANP